MLRGTRIITGIEAKKHTLAIEMLRNAATYLGFQEVILPSIWEQQTFIDKAGPEIVNQMWAFNDKGNRPVCLIPEVTGLIQEVWRNEWSKDKKPYRVFYVNRCYRYEIGRAHV